MKEKYVHAIQDLKVDGSRRKFQSLGDSVPLLGSQLPDGQLGEQDRYSNIIGLRNRSSRYLAEDSLLSHRILQRELVERNEVRASASSSGSVANW